MKIFICLFLVSAFFSTNSFGQRVKEDSLHLLMQGEWNSLQDSGYHINFSGSHIKEYYQGARETNTFAYAITRKSCDSLLSSTLGTGFFLVKIEKDKSTLCYAITDISKDYLELVYAGGRILSFKKVTKR